MGQEDDSQILERSGSKAWYSSSVQSSWGSPRACWWLCDLWYTRALPDPPHKPSLTALKQTFPPPLPGVVREMSRTETATLQGTGLGHPKGSDMQIRPPCLLTWGEEEEQRLSRVFVWSRWRRRAGNSHGSACRVPTWRWWTPS